MGALHCVGGPTRWRLRWQAAKVAVVLSLLFVIVYGATNWLTAQRPDAHLRVWYFAWELRATPYVPLLIVPYMSIDLLFFFAAFLCRDERELRTFVRRVVFSILTAAGFFLLLPLKLGWPPRPHVGGWFGNFVEQSCNAPLLMEYPHNLFPALHITLCLIVAERYARHTGGSGRVLVCVWFALIGLSTMLTWQHHAVDLAGGLVLAAFAFYLFRDSVVRLPVVPNVHVGCYYAAGAAVVLALIPGLWPWGVFLLWPAAGLGIMSAGYFGLGPGLFRKEGGRLPLSTRFVLAPVLLGQWLSLVYYRCRCRAWDAVTPGLLMGRALTDREAEAVVQEGVTAVLDLTAELSEPKPFLTADYCNLPVLDLTAPTMAQLQEAVAFISEKVAAGTVYVHCKIGYSRSAAVAGAYLLATGKVATAAQATDLLRTARPSTIIRPETLKALRAFEQTENVSRYAAG
jgi:Dual specificity phosphatase, catalytic domain/PAP2 superfamily